MKKITLAYFGSPSFSALFLEKLLSDYSINRIIEVKLVVTQPDRPVGRKQILTPTPVRQVAEKYKIPLYYFEDSKLEIRNSKPLINPNNQIPITKQYQNSNDQNSKQKSFENLNFEYLNLFSISNLQFRIFKNIDLALVYAFGQIVPKSLLGLPKYGFWCVHPSLLPKYRGPSPIAYPLILGEKKTGVTIFQMDEKVDHGPIIAQEELEISDTDRRPDLEIKLTNLAFSMFKKIIFQLTSSGVNELPSNKTRKPVNPLTLKPQDNKYATSTRLLKKSDGFIPLPVLKKTLNNQPLTFEELPSLIKEYLIKNSNNQAPITQKKLDSKFKAQSIKETQSSNDQNRIKCYPELAYPNERSDEISGSFNRNIENWGLKIENSSKIIHDYFRGLYPWPGLWTQIRPTRSEAADYKRLKITDLALVNNKLMIKKVQLEGKKEVDFEVFNKAYQVF